MPLRGFQEHGQPKDWDFAVGTVRGFRWWTLDLPLREENLRSLARYDNVWFSGFWEPGAEITWGRDGTVRSPDLRRADILGMHGGSWLRHSYGASVTQYGSGRHEARCTVYARSMNLFGQYTDGKGTPAHSQQDIPASGCGCGFWAYWDDLPASSQNFPLLRRAAHGEVQMSIPVAGVIEGSGRVIIGEKGFRSAAARVTDVAVTGLDGTPGFYYEDRPSFYEYWQDPSGNPCALVNFEPRPVPDFLAHVTRETGIPAHVLVSAAKVVAGRAFGERLRYHESVARLLRDAERDPVYRGG